MQVIQINTASGTPPYDIYVCDETITYCYFVLTGVSVFPVYIDLPPFLTGIRNVIVKLIDANGCELFYNIPCMLPTPSVTVTPSFTPTPTPTPTIPQYPCSCVIFDNTGSGDNIGYSYLSCNGVLTIGVVNSGTTLTVCGSQPISDSIKMSVTVGVDCVDNVCFSGPCISPAEFSTIKSVNRIYKSCTNGYDGIQHTCVVPASQVNIGSIDYNGEEGCVEYPIWAGSSYPTGKDYNFKVGGAGITSWTQLQIGMRLYPATQSPNTACGNIPSLNYWVSRNSLSNRYTVDEGAPIILRVNDNIITNITDCA